MERVQLASLGPGTVLEAEELGSNVSLPAAATVRVFKHGTETVAPVYTEETGEATLAQPFAIGAGGAIPGWVPSGQRLDLEITIGATTVTRTVEPLAAAAPVEVVQAANVHTVIANYTLPDVGTHLLTVDEDAEITPPEASAAGTTKSMLIRIKQGEAGSKKLTFVGVKWPEGELPTFSEAPGEVDYIGLVSVDGAPWDGFVPGVNWS